MVLATLLLVMASAAGEPPPDFFAPNEELRGYLIEAGENHPALKQRHAEWLAALKRIPQVTSLEDPMFTFGGFLQSTSNRLKFNLSQQFPWFGTLRARGEKAAAEADAALARLEMERDRVYAAVKDAYFEYQYLYQRIQVTESQTEVLEYVEEIAQTRYSLAIADQDEVLRVQIESEKLRDLSERLQQMRPALAAQLNEAIGRETVREIEWPQDTAFPPSPPPAELAVAWIRSRNPMLREYDHRLEGLDRDIVLARKKGKPNFTVGLDYTTMSQPGRGEIRPDRPFPAALHGGRRLLDTVTGQAPLDPIGAGFDLYAVGNNNRSMAEPIAPEDNFLVTLSMSVPIYRGRIRGGIEEAKHREAAAEHEKHRTSLALERDARVALFEIEDAMRSRALNLDSLIPKAQQTFESLQAAYASGAGNTSFIDVLDSVQELLELDLNVVRLERDWQQAAARLERLMGGSWAEFPAGESAEENGKADETPGEESEDNGEDLEENAETPGDGTPEPVTVEAVAP